MDAWPGADWERSTGDRLTVRQVKGIIEGASPVGAHSMKAPPLWLGCVA